MVILQRHTPTLRVQRALFGCATADLIKPCHQGPDRAGVFKEGGRLCHRLAHGIREPVTGAFFLRRIALTADTDFVAGRRYTRPVASVPWSHVEV